MLAASDISLSTCWKTLEAKIYTAQATELTKRRGKKNCRLNNLLEMSSVVVVIYFIKSLGLWADLMLQA